MSKEFISGNNNINFINSDVLIKTVVFKSLKFTYLSVFLDAINSQKFIDVINRKNVNSLLCIQFYSDKLLTKKGYKISHKHKYLEIHLIYLITPYKYIKYKHLIAASTYCNLWIVNKYALKKLTTLWNYL